jgi:hypothetical protein
MARVSIWIAALGCALPFFVPLTPQVRLAASLAGALAPAIPWLAVVVGRQLVTCAGHLRRRRQFSLRGLLVLVVVCSAGMAIWDHWFRPGYELRQFMAAVAELGGTASTDSYYVRFSLSEAANEDLAYLASLPGRRKVVEVTLNRPSITDDGMAHLASFPDLNMLVLDDCHITDDGVKRLQDLAHLRCLYIVCTTITDDGVAWLADRQELWMVNLIGTPVSSAKLAELRAALPYCNVVRP